MIRLRDLLIALDLWADNAIFYTLAVVFSTMLNYLCVIMLMLLLLPLC